MERSNVTKVNFVSRCRTTAVPGCLLPAYVDPETVGKLRVRFVRSFYANMFGPYAYTDMVDEQSNGYVRVYIPRVGYADMHKSQIVEA